MASVVYSEDGNYTISKMLAIIITEETAVQTSGTAKT
jgi:hypothetical protein